MSQLTTAVARTQYLSFAVASEEYAIEILRVREIIEYGVLTRVPAMPPCVRGVINLRGSVVPVLDVAARFGLDAAVVTRRSCIVMVEVAGDDGRRVVGLLADAVSQVLDLGPDDVEPPPPFGTRVGHEFLSGMARADQKFVMLLDVDRTVRDADVPALAPRTLESAAEPAMAEPSTVEAAAAGRA